MSSTLPPPPSSKARNPRRSPRSVAIKLTPSTTSPLPTKKLNFDEVEEDSFLAGFSESLKFPDDDSWAWTDAGNANPFRAAAAPAPTVAASTTSSAAAPASAAPTYQFTSVFESNDPLEEQSGYQVSEVVVSEATTTVGSNLLADKLLANMNSSPNDDDDGDMSSDQPVPVPAPANTMIATPENSPKKVTVQASVRKWSRGKFKEMQRRSISHVRGKDRNSNDKVNRQDQVEKEAQVHAAVPVGDRASGKDKEEMKRRTISHVIQKDRKSNDEVNRRDRVEEEAQIIHAPAPVRNWSRGKVKEELQRRSITHVREKVIKINVEDNHHDQVEEEAQVHSDEGGNMKEATRRGRSHSRNSKTEERDVPPLFPNTNTNAAEDESTFCGGNSLGTNSLTYQDNATLYTEDDSRTFVTPTPTPSSHRSRYSRQGNGRLLCGCEDTGRMADTMESLKGALTDINRSMMQIISPIANVKCYVSNVDNDDDNDEDETYDDATYEETYDDATYEETYDDATYDDATYDDATYDDATYDDDVRPSRRRSQQHVKQRSKSISVRRDREPSTAGRSRRGKSCDAPRGVTRID